MTFEELIAELQKHKDSEEYANFIKTIINKDSVMDYLTNDSNGKELFESKTDARVRQAIETWKTNNLDGVVQAKIKELYPEADPKDTELAAVKAELEKMKAESLRKDLTNKALTIANEKGLPVDLIDYFVGSDEKTTTDNISKFEKAFNDALGSAVQKKLKDGSYVPPEGDPEPIDGVTAAFAKLNPGLKIQTATE